MRKTDIVSLHKEATKYAETLQRILSTGEYGYLMEGLRSKAIHEPQLLINIIKIRSTTNSQQD
eukprot:10632458-Ditylum_brightwellii.AAC.1